MPANPQVAELYASIEKSARLLGVSYSAEKTTSILSAFADAFAHPEAVVAFRVATALRHAGELDCRFRVHPDEKDPYGRALSHGFLTETDHPISALLRDVDAACPTDSHGVDFGVVGGFKKLYSAFTPDQLQTVATLADVPSMPRGLGETVDFYTRHGLADKVGVISIDYPERTMNVYFNEIPTENFEPATIRSTLREIGMAEPSEAMLKLGEKAFGLYVTLSWDSAQVVRICYAAATTDLTTLPIPVEPEIEKFVESVPYGGEDRKFVYGVAVTPKGEYYKLESHYMWRSGSLDFI